MSALERMATPLLFAEQLRSVRGKTRLQKLVCLLDARLEGEGRTLGYEFQFYHYGPFSFDLMNEVEDLVDEELLKETTRTLPNGYVEFSYSLTGAGRRFLRRILGADPELSRLRSRVAELAKSHGSLPLRELVDQAYAARPNLGENPSRR
jgi:uncharacterized protein YwgA